VVRLLRRGHKIAYVADAVVRHSHRYTLRQEFQRYFDTGYGRRMYQHLFPEVGEAARGRAYARLLLGRVARERPALLPYAALTLAAKSAGYTLGRVGHLLPVAARARLSAQDFYWDSAFRDVTEPCAPGGD
jgi:rhamnosyltransferase